MIQLMIRLLALCLSLTLQPHAASAQHSTIKIGVMVCLTGACMEMGTNSLHGIQLAQEEINAAGGILGKKIELVVQDTREMDSPKNAVSAYQNLRLDKDIKLIIGPTWTVGALPLTPIIARDRDIIVTSPSLGVESFNESADNIFNLWPHDSIATKALAKFAIDHGWDRVAVISDQFPWESTLAKVFREEYKRLGGKEALFVETTGNETDLRFLASRIKQANPNALFLSNYTQIGLTGRALRDLRVSLPMLTILLENSQIAISDGTLEGIYFAEYEAATADFNERYFKKFKTQPGLASDTGYDTLRLYAMALEQSPSDSALIKTLLESRFKGASGDIVFDAKGGMVKTPLIRMLSKGARVPAALYLD